MKQKHIILKLFTVFLFLFVFLTVTGKNAKAEELKNPNTSVVRLKIEDKKGNILYRNGVAVGQKKEGADRFILTVKDGLEDVNSIEVEFNGLQPIELKVKKISDKADMAVLSIQAGSNSEFNPVLVGDAKKLKAGDPVKVMGIPDSSSDKINVKQSIISDVDIRGDFDSFSISGEMASENYYGAPVFDKDNSLVGIVTAPDPTVQDRTDIAHVNYISTVLAEGLYDMPKEKDNRMLFLAIGSVALFLVLGGILFSFLKKKKTERFIAKESFEGHSDGKTVAIIPQSAKKKEEGSIIGMTGYFAGKQFAVGNQLVIGRDPNKVQVVFPSKTMGVSAVHCELRNNGGTLMLVDLGSSYGTFLGQGEKLQASMPHVLHSGDEFFLGAKENRFKVL